MRFHIGVMMVTAMVLASGVQAEEAPAFTLKDTDGTPHSLADFKGKTVVLEWVNHSCPFVMKHYGSGNMQALQKRFTEAGVVWLSICSSAPGKSGNMSAATWKEVIAKKGAVATAVLLDDDGTVGKAYEAKTTPQMFVINGEGQIVYKGAIDSISSTNPEDIAKSDNYVVQALEALAKGEAPATASTAPYGCSVKY